MDNITITASPELSEMRLDELVGRTGKIVEILYHKDTGIVRGAWVELTGESYQGEKEWYIPCESILE